MDWVPLAGGGADLSQQVVELGERRLRLTTKERDLLAYLAANPGRTVTRQELIVKVWGHPAHASDEPVYSAIKRLRAKIDQGTHRHIVGVHGDGYRWSPPEVAEGAGRPLPERTAQAPAVTRTRFFGRAMELAAVASAFAAGARLVTLVGPGGAGKTRCALEVASGRDHVVCDLSSATTEGGVVAAVAAALDLPLDGAEPAEWARGVGRALGAAPDRLVVLDNAEQATEVIAAIVASWVPLGPALLVTSREPLRVAGEHVVSVGPLPPAEGVALFADRALAAGGDPGDPETQAALVGRLDGLPLAIELAAAQVRELGARALLESLDAQLATLVMGARSAPSRHATLRAAVEWSWTLLPAREREVLVRLAVFTGSFTLDAARAVVGRGDAAAVIANLCRRCQMRRERERFELYAAVRELARERGDERERTDAQALHGAYYAAAAEAAADLLEGPRHLEGAAALASDLPELREAWKNALGHDGALAARLALAIDRGLGQPAATTRRDLLARSRRGLDARCHPELACALLLAEGRIEGAPMGLLDEACALAAGPRALAEVRLARGERLAATGLAAARGELERALELAVEAGIEPVRGRALAALGEVAWAHGRVADASARLRAALAIHLAAGDRRAVAHTSALLAHVDRLETGAGAARALLAQAEQAAAALGDPLVRARVLVDVGQHLTRIGDQAGARDALREAGELYERVGFARDRALLHLHVGETLVGIGELDRALEEALAAWAALPDPAEIGRSTIHEAIGCIHMLRGDLVEAERWLEEGLSIARAHDAARSECTLLGKRGLLHLVRGSAERAWDDFDAATRKNEARGSVTIAGASLADRAMASFALGRDQEAERDLARGRELLHHPSDEQVDGRMLAMCEIVGRAFGAVRGGMPPPEAHARARAETARFFRRVPPNEWDVVLRLLDWLVDRIGGAAAAVPRPKA